MISSLSGLAAPATTFALPNVGGAGQAAHSFSAPSGGTFEAMMKDVAANAVGALKSAESASVLGVRGQLPAQDVVQAVMSAEQTLQTVIAVRDKVVAAYLDLTRMQI